jgi:hypothetical protein
MLLSAILMGAPSVRIPPVSRRPALPSAVLLAD